MIKVESCLYVNALTGKVFNLCNPCNLFFHYHYNIHFLYFTSCVAKKAEGAKGSHERALFRRSF